MTRRRAATLGACLVVCLGPAPADGPVDGKALAQPEDEPKAEKAHAAETQAMARAQAATYAFHPSGGGTGFVARPEPVLKWTNPVFGTVYGHVFVWTDRGRPEVVGSFLKWYQPFTHITDEFHSLSLGPIVGEKDGRQVWSSAKPGLELKPIPEAPAPAATPAGRLRQMRDLAKEFAGRQTDRNGVDRDLRLLSQPLYRYEGTEGDLVDGALFTFAMGTDPDAFLLVEARRASGPARWEYALVRMTTLHMKISHRGREVWDVPTLDYKLVYGHREPYTSFRFDRPEAAAPRNP